MMARMPSYPVVRIALATLLAATTHAYAAPRVPADDAMVLERLPFRPTDEVARALRSLRAQVAARPQDPEPASELARAYFRMALRDGDPRYVGYGEAVLAPWWNRDDVPAPVLVARGLLRQYRHDFGGALDDLGRAGALAPADETIWSWRAALHVVRADYPGARADCAQLRRHVSPTSADACEAWIDGIEGRAEAAYDAMHAAYVADRDAGPAGRLWTLTRLAELALQLDDPVRAEAHFREALALPVKDQYLLGAYADFLLAHGREREVVERLRGERGSDTLLLRLVIAEQRLGLPTAADRRREMAARFAASAHRADGLHRHEEARFALEVQDDPPRAVALARDNYRLQREPRDARLLLEAAVAAGSRDAATPVLAWLAATRHEDPRLRRLAEKLRVPAR